MINHLIIMLINVSIKYVYVFHLMIQSFHGDVI